MSTPSSSLEGLSSRPIPLRVRRMARATIRIAGKTVQATLMGGEGMEMRIAATMQKLTPGTTLEVSI